MLNIFHIPSFLHIYTRDESTSFLISFISSPQFPTTLLCTEFVWWSSGPPNCQIPGTLIFWTSPNLSEAFLLLRTLCFLWGYRTLLPCTCLLFFLPPLIRSVSLNSISPGHVTLCNCSSWAHQFSGSTTIWALKSLHWFLRKYNSQ